MNHLDLFSGIGGFSLALQLAKIPITQTYYSDINEFSNLVYEKNFPTAIALGDIHAIDGRELRAKHPGHWIVTGGFPCQDISSAGFGKGLEGKRSGLWYQMLRIIDELRPEYVLAENVSALKTRGLIDVLRGLDAIGYDAEWTTLSAQDVGAIHKRQRLWITSNPRNADLPPVSAPHELPKSGRDMGKEQKYDCETHGVITRADWQRIQTERAFLGQPLVYGKNSWLPNHVDRIKALGNSIVPQCAAAFLRHRFGHLTAKPYPGNALSP
jgi:DNA (cytosine-5)-methyltransferase 1